MVAHNKNIADCDIVEIVDCIGSKLYGDSPETLINYIIHLEPSPRTDFLKVLCVPYLFHAVQEIFTSEKEPISTFTKTLYSLEKHISNIFKSNSFKLLFDYSYEYSTNENENEVEKETGEHYGNLFKNFTIKQYLEAKELLETRLKVNDIIIPGMEQKTLLDQGSGGGRYTVAWKLLGVKKATGLDISKTGIEDARRKVEFLQIKEVEFIEGSVLNIPFDNNTFDIVFSNGVLHHTTDWQQGIKEQVRVLKPGGFGWQYLIENPGGIFWDKIEILRAIMKGVNKNFARNAMAALGIPENRIFYMLDHVMVPINTRVSPEELYEELAKAGAKKIKRLERGTHFDRIEQIYQAIPYATEKFGVGENRFIFTK